MTVSDSYIDTIISRVHAQEHVFNLFRDNVARFFETHPLLRAGPLPLVHSVKSRLKDYDHLRDKIRRKVADGREITPDNVFEQITDSAGVRVLHLYQQQLSAIHDAIQKHVTAKEWVLTEPPTAYSWDPEASSYFEALGLQVEIKDSYYTSVHYLIRPRDDAPVCCEIQVRTLFEEVWGEIDHAINYPYPTHSLPLREQLRVLSKLVATGSRLADSIFTILNIDRDGDAGNS